MGQLDRMIYCQLPRQQIASRIDMPRQHRLHKAVDKRCWYREGEFADGRTVCLNQAI